MISLRKMESVDGKNQHLRMLTPQPAKFKTAICFWEDKHIFSSSWSLLSLKRSQTTSQSFLGFVGDNTMENRNVRALREWVSLSFISRCTGTWDILVDDSHKLLTFLFESCSYMSLLGRNTRKSFFLQLPSLHWVQSCLFLQVSVLALPTLKGDLG